MKVMFKIVFLALFATSLCLAADKKRGGILMLNGMENVYPGMPVAELLKTRPRLESGTNLMDIFDRGELLRDDKNDPKKININTIEAKWPQYGYHFKEKAEIPLLRTIYYYFPFQPRLQHIEINGQVITRKQIKDYPQKRDKLIEHVIQKWGKPDKVFAGELISDSFRTGTRHDYYTIELEWNKGDVFMELNCPVAVDEYNKTISLAQKLWWRILGYGIPVDVIITDDPGIKTLRRKPPFYSHYKPVGAEETERLLNSIKYYEILEQSLKMQNPN